MPSVSKQTEKLISLFSIKDIVKKKLDSNLNFEEYCIVLVDTNQPSITDLQDIFSQKEALEVWKGCKTRVILDHHLQSEEIQIPNDYQLIIPEYNAASELAYDLYKQGGIQDLEKKFLSITLLGILFDTKRLVLANARVLATVSDILSQIGETIENYLHYLESEKEY